MNTPKDTYTMQDTAKFLGFGSKTLFRRLRAQRILNPKNLPYQTFIDRDYFLVEAKTFEKWNGQQQTYGRTRVTEKGLHWLKQQLGNNDQPSPAELKTRLNHVRNEMLQIACHCIETNRNDIAGTLAESVSAIVQAIEELRT